MGGTAWPSDHYMYIKVYADHIFMYIKTWHYYTFMYIIIEAPDKCRYNDDGESNREQIC